MLIDDIRCQSKQTLEQTLNLFSSPNDPDQPVHNTCFGIQAETLRQKYFVSFSARIRANEPVLLSKLQLADSVITHLKANTLKSHIPDNSTSQSTVQSRRTKSAMPQSSIYSRLIPSPFPGFTTTTRDTTLGRCLQPSQIATDNQIRLLRIVEI